MDRDQLHTGTMSSCAAAPIGNGSLVPADSSGAWAPPDPVPLQAFVAGHTLRETHTVFEAGMNPFVKVAMKVAFTTDETDPADPCVAALAAAAAEEAAEVLRIQDADLPDARKQLAMCIAAKAAAEAAGSSKGTKAANKAVAKSEDKVRELEDRLWALDRDAAAAEATRTRADELPAAQSASAASAAAASPTQSGAEAKMDLGKTEARL